MCVCISYFTYFTNIDHTILFFYLGLFVLYQNKHCSPAATYLNCIIRYFESRLPGFGMDNLIDMQVTRPAHVYSGDSPDYQETLSDKMKATKLWLMQSSTTNTDIIPTLFWMIYLWIWAVCFQPNSFASDNHENICSWFYYLHQIWNRIHKPLCKVGSWNMLYGLLCFY